MKSMSIATCLLLAFVAPALFSQVPEIGIRRLGPPADLPVARSQESLDALRLRNVPADARPIRERQLEAASEQGVELGFSHQGLVARTGIRGVPLDMRTVVVENEAQVSALANMLYPLFGFTGAEGLVYQGKVGNDYRFRQEIAGILVESVRLSVVVGRDRKIMAIRGSALVDRDFRRDHVLSEARAIAAVNRYLEQKEIAFDESHASRHVVSLMYRCWNDCQELAPWWLVSHARGAGYYVAPDGEVSSAIQIQP